MLFTSYLRGHLWSLKMAPLYRHITDTLVSWPYSQWILIFLLYFIETVHPPGSGPTKSFHIVLDTIQPCLARTSRWFNNNPFLVIIGKYSRNFFHALLTLACHLAATDKLVEKIAKHDSWPMQPDILSPPLLRLTSRKPLWLDLQPVDIKSRCRHNWKSAQVVNSHLVCNPTIRL